jgi:hypothetical protein
MSEDASSPAEDIGHPVADERAAPPFISFKTFLGLLERMEKPGPPRRVDRSILVGMSGSSQSQVMSSLRSLGLTDDNDTVTPLLTRLVQDREGRPKLLGDLLRERFPTLVALGEQSATHGELVEEVRRLGRSGDGGRKAIAFFLSAATYAGLKLSPHFTPPRVVTTRPAGSRRRPGAKGRGRGSKPATGQGADGGQAPAASGDDMTRVYFDLLVDKARRADKPDSDLLDRIERVLGIENQQVRKDHAEEDKAGTETNQD